MGCGNSAPASSKERKVVQHRAFKHIIESLRMKPEEVDVLYKLFDDADKSRDGFLSNLEFFKLFELKSSLFTRRILQLFDRNKNEEVDFGEFLSGTWKYLSLSRFSTISLCFHLLDMDGSGLINAKEVKQLVSELMEDPSFETSLLADLDLDAVGGRNMDEKHGKNVKINEQRFVQFAIKFPGVLYPALRVQEGMRAAIGGMEFWERACEARGGLPKVAETKGFLSEIKAKTLRENGLSTALSILKDGNLPENAIATKKEAEGAKLAHDLLYGAKTGSGRSLLRQASSIFSSLSGGGGGGARSVKKKIPTPGDGGGGGPGAGPGGRRGIGQMARSMSGRMLNALSSGGKTKNAGRNNTKNINNKTLGAGGVGFGDGEMNDDAGGGGNGLKGTKSFYQPKSNGLSGGGAAGRAGLNSKSFSLADGGDGGAQKKTGTATSRIRQVVRQASVVMRRKVTGNGSSNKEGKKSAVITPL